VKNIDEKIPVLIPSVKLINMGFDVVDAKTPFLENILLDVLVWRNP